MLEAYIQNEGNLIGFKSCGESEEQDDLPIHIGTEENHSKLTRKIKDRLKHINIEYNPAVIIQMSLEGKPSILKLM